MVKCKYCDEKMESGILNISKILVSIPKEGVLDLSFLTKEQIAELIQEIEKELKDEEQEI